MTFRSVVAAGVLLVTAAAQAHASVKKEAWGTAADGTAVSLYTIKDANLTVTITTFGARIVSILAPDKNGKVADVVLGYKTVGEYENDKTTYFGAIVGRYGNRIAKGTFTIDGNAYHVPLNNNGNALHGGPGGFSTKVWTAKQLSNGVEMTLVSPDADMGFPGELTAHVRYTVEGSSLLIAYSATTTKSTVLNLTNHSYFNLNGEASGTILNETIMIPADRFTPTDALLIPTGKLAPVAGTPFDFTKPTAIGLRINDKDEQLVNAGGYDHNWVLNGSGKALHTAAVVTDLTSGRTLTVSTTEPGVQFYTGNFLDGTAKGISGAPYVKNAALCLETQHFPDSPNEPSFPSTELKPGQMLHSTTVFTFGVKR